MVEVSERSRNRLIRHARLLIWVGVLVAALVGIVSGPVVGLAITEGSANPLGTSYFEGEAPESAGTTLGFPALLGWNLLYCFLLGAIEETVFCGGVLPIVERIVGFVRRDVGAKEEQSLDRRCELNRRPEPNRRSDPNRRSEPTMFCGGLCGKRVLPVVLVVAALFGVAHVWTGAQLECGWLGVAVKIIQAMLFGVCMVSLYLISGKLWQPVLAHTAFDFIYVGIPNIAAGIVPLDVVPATSESVAGMVGSGILLLGTAIVCCWMLRQIAQTEQRSERTRGQKNEQQ